MLFKSFKLVLKRIILLFLDGCPNGFVGWCPTGLYVCCNRVEVIFLGHFFPIGSEIWDAVQYVRDMCSTILGATSRNFGVEFVVVVVFVVVESLIFHSRAFVLSKERLSKPYASNSKSLCSSLTSQQAASLRPNHSFQYCCRVLYSSFSLCRRSLLAKDDCAPQTRASSCSSVNWLHPPPRAWRAAKRCPLPASTECELNCCTPRSWGGFG